jgi:hypothetical protein
MQREDLTQYDIKPKHMVNYLRYNGPHFSKELCEFAVSKMRKRINGKEVTLQAYTKEDVDKILDTYGVKLHNTNVLYDYVYVANMCKADFLGSSVPDERSLALYIKDVIDDVDGYDGLVFNRWYADTCKKGIVIDWASMI